MPFGMELYVELPHEAARALFDRLGVAWFADVKLEECEWEAAAADVGELLSGPVVEAQLAVLRARVCPDAVVVDGRVVGTTPVLSGVVRVCVVGGVR